MVVMAMSKLERVDELVSVTICAPTDVTEAL
jgi:hypothetical protein